MIKNVVGEHSTVNLGEFKKSLVDGKCPFCQNSLRYYDGGLGYEAMRCYDCNFSLDLNGFHLDDLPTQEGEGKWEDYINNSVSYWKRRRKTEHK